MKQIFGYTDPTNAAPGGYVKFLMAHVNDDGNVVVQVRNEQCVINEIILPAASAVDLADALHGNV